MLRRTDDFRRITKKLSGLLKQLEGSMPIDFTKDSSKILSNRGVYAFFSKDAPIYVGRANRTFRQRFRQHVGRSSQHNQASFAFKMAKIEVMRKGIDSRNMTRKELSKIPEFKVLLSRCKERIKTMKFRVVKIEDSKTQYLFEAFAAMEWNTKYNDFDTH